MYEVQTVSTRQAPPAARTALWSATITAFQGSHRYGYPCPDRFGATATRQRTERFQLVAWHIEDAQTIWRDSQSDDNYRLLFLLAGSARLGTHGLRYRLTPARGLLFAPSTAFELRLPAGSRGLVATLPGTEVGFRRHRHRPSFLRLGRSPGRVLALMLTTLVEDRAGLTRLGFDTVCAQAAELALLVADEAPGGPGQDLVAELRRVARQRAHDPELTATTLARHVGWSLRQVQAVLRQEGTTPSALIRDSRLLLARDLLERRASITSVAQASGFCSLDTFEKAFRRRYGSTPSAYRAQRGYDQRLR